MNLYYIWYKFLSRLIKKIKNILETHQEIEYYIKCEVMPTFIGRRVTNKFQWLNDNKTLHTDTINYWSEDLEEPYACIG